MLMKAQKFSSPVAVKINSYSRENIIHLLKHKMILKASPFEKCFLVFVYREQSRVTLEKKLSAVWDSSTCYVRNQGR